MTRLFGLRTITAALAALTLLGPAAVRAQDLGDRFTLHGSLLWGYGQSDGLPVFGVTKHGTTDYFAAALQFRYLISAKDQFVVQLLSRELGSSPLAALEPTVFPVYAYYQHRSGDWTFKAGRNPLPRGIFNEVRFIGTLLPFYRVGADVYGETMEFLDGVEVSRRIGLGRGWSAEANAIAGGNDFKVLLPGGTGVTVLAGRAERMVGGQAWINTPIRGLRVGGFIAGFTPFTDTDTVTNGRQLTTMYSVDGNFDRAFARAEWTEFSGKSPTRSSLRSWYAQAGLHLNERFTVAGQFMTTSRYIEFGPPLAPLTLKLSDDVAGSIAYAPSASVMFKFELHTKTGYSFDTNVPTFIPPTGPPFVMGLARPSKANFLIASFAISF